MGQYSSFTIDDSNKDEIILLSTGNRLGYSQNARTLHSFRCHFEVPTTDDAPAARDFILDFGEEMTGIGATLNDKGKMINDKWYTLDGRRLGGKPTKAGLYIHGNKKVMIK